MEIWQYFLITVIAGCGIFCGKLLGGAAKEELKQGKKYLTYLKEVCMIIFLAFLFMVIFQNYQALAFIYLLLLVSCILFLYFARKDILLHEVEHNYLNYSVFAVALFFAVGSPKLFFSLAALVFLYGLPTGSILLQQKAELKEYLIPGVLFVAIASVLFLGFY